MVSGGDRAARHAGQRVRLAGRRRTENDRPRSRAAVPPRLIRARHHARFSSGVLSGRSELVIEAARSGPADFILEPWTPAILATPQTPKVVGARDSGEPSLWIDQSPNQTIVLDWELQPRSHVPGRSFALALPGNETTVLTLDVPKDWVPSCRRGRRRGPPSRYGRLGSEPVGNRIGVRSNRRSPVRTWLGRVARGNEHMGFRIDADRPAERGRSRGKSGQLEDGMAGRARSS